MRIGIDATALPLQPVGAGNYIIHFTQALANLEINDELVIFTYASRQPLFGIQPGSRVKLIALPELSPPRRLIWEQTNLPALIRQYKLDLFHSLHYTMPVFLPCPNVVTFHDMTFFLYPRLHTMPKRIFFQNMIRYSAKHATALVADSESTRQDAIRLLGLAPERITTVPLGVTAAYHPVRDLARQDIVRQKYQLPERFILNVGLMEPRKNLPALLRAFSKICEHFPAEKLVLVGRKGWMVDQVFNLLDSLALLDKVCFTGYVDGEDLPVIYSMADIFVYPTFYEGFGLPVLEAMACGTPVITSNTSSLPEIVGDAGVLLAPDDAEGLATALERLLLNEDERKIRSIRGLELASAFTWERTARLTWQVYQQVR